MECWSFLCLGLLIAIPVFSAAGPMPPYNLQCDRNLVGLSKEQLRRIKLSHHFATENPHPVLSWSIKHSERGAYQRSFQVKVTRGFNLSNVIWDSKIVSSSQQQVTYQGPPLVQGELYLWNVTWWDHNGTAAQSVEMGHFLSAVGVSWEDVSWITSSIPITNAQTFVKKIDLTGKKVSKAILYISGLGLYRAYVNGYDLHQMSDPPIFFVPGWTNYQFRVGYQVFAVTELVKRNLQTMIKVSLGEGYRNTSVFTVHDKDMSPVPDDVERILRVQLKIEFSDGTQPMVITSDESWDVYTSKFLQTSIYNGELYDALVTESMVAKATVTGGPAGVMYLPNIPNIVETGYDSPIEIYYLPNATNVQIVDFGINTAGVVNISVAEVPAGEQISIKHAEILTHRLHVHNSFSNESYRPLYVANLRSAAQLDTYISNGADLYYKPTFTYHGFRYISVTNYPRKLTFKDLKRVRISTNLKLNSKFNTSNSFLNQLQKNVIVSHQSNLLTIPTDCDQRDERLGWMGDAGLSADAMAMNFHMESYFPHRMMIIKDDEFNGSIPEITPYYRYGGRPAESTWAGAYTQTAWVLMKQYGDTDTARNFMSGFLEYIAFMEKEIGKDIINIKGRNGDWCQPPEYKKVDDGYTSAFSLMLSIQQVVEMAREIGYNNNLSSLLANHVTQFNGHFLNQTSGIYKPGYQICYALPMFLDAVPLGTILPSVRLLNQVTDGFNFHLSTGIVGTKAILPVLSKTNQNNIAIEAVSSFVYPSYGFMWHNPYEPATAMWELWNSHNGSAHMDSRNHHMFSSVSGWMQTDMIGFKQVEGTYGYKEIDLYPASSYHLSAASIELDYPKPIKYSWQRKGGLQCGKSAEDRSSINPGLPKHEGLVVSCGEGVISEVLFASYGNPTGVCGYHRYGDCHAENSMDIVQKACRGKAECRVQTDGDFWGDPCPGQVEVKWLTVAVQCSSSYMQYHSLLNRYSSLSVDVSIPMQSIAHVNLPAYGLDNIEILDGDKLVYSGNNLLATNGLVSASWIPEKDILKLDVVSGDYSFTIRGGAPNETHTVEFDPGSKYADFKCTDSDNVISSIDWVSFGDPERDRSGVFMLGQFHSHASQMIVESHCRGKNSCSVPMDENLFFAGSPTLLLKVDWHLVVHFSCNNRN